MKHWESRTRNVRDAAAILPVAAIFLLLPPVILIFSAPVLIANIPLIVLYVYGVWAGLILIALMVALRVEEAGRNGKNEPDEA
ncbi:MAG: hypothetical protein KJ904_06615 [Alphaproteobacteria bacterium]|nr:hypothetical protein [Alphaproteobacteria bacterium]MBU0796045.1 hypothetical protein [Alphaproteobacteria bacterium]MBU0886820.1 hypothetical protein [Alphaproteobacteria bacterium]MBU1812438.1 hypothetical protein [Alphaproteobacteria bacterium]MBU2091461.1 hypothetical protein [Alphaproteobacteria bacterium]